MARDAGAAAPQRGPLGQARGRSGCRKLPPQRVVDTSVAHPASALVCHSGPPHPRRPVPRACPAGSASRSWARRVRLGMAFSATPPTHTKCTFWNHPPASRWVARSWSGQATEHGWCVMGIVRLPGGGGQRRQDVTARPAPLLMPWHACSCPCWHPRPGICPLPLLVKRAGPVAAAP